MTGKRLNQEEFVRRSRAVHGDKYDYSLAVFKTCSEPVTIICPEHGPFEQRPINHYKMKQGCPKCGLIKLGMTIRSNTDDFIRKAREIHGDKYGYDRVNYVKQNIPVEIYCPNCGEYFLQQPKCHLRGHGCPKCANNLPHTTEEFIRKAKEVHGDRYIYDKSVYTTNKAKIIVTCPIHGDWQTNPYDHLIGHGCPQCGYEAMKAARRKDQEQFIADCRRVHGDKYDYSQTVYQGKRKKVAIICRKHGPFKQWPGGHLNGQGCPVCKFEKESAIQSKGAAKFIEEARKVHGDYYDYSQVNYINNKTNVTVICPKHGPFEVMPQDHLQKMNGCPKCSCSKGEKKILVWLEAHGIDYVWHKSLHSDLAVGKRKKFIPDFRLPDRDNMIIEYNGDQHYKAVSKWGGEKQLKHQQKRDAALRQYCEDNHILLLEIHYKDFDRIEEILERELL